MICAVGVGFVWWVWKGELDKAALKIPNLPDIMQEISKQPTTIYSADGKILYEISTEKRIPIKIDEVPQFVINATLAAEDKRFYQHGGIDAQAIGRVLFTNVREGRMAQGGSTLTMQLAKRVYSDGSKTWRRKVQDMALAVMMERELTKDQILELYLNECFYGSGAYGIQAAADIYFGKKIDKLTIGEAALLARLVRRPSQENPYANKQRAIQNRDIVLGIMRDEKMISEEQYAKAINEKPKFRSRSRKGPGISKRAPYFVDYVLDLLKDELPGVDITSGGYRIETTLNTKLEDVAEHEVRDLVNHYRSSGIRTAALLLTDREGRILAMVGGVNYDRNQYNVIAQGHRQPGSSFKPFVYSAAFENGDLSPSDRLSNQPFVWHSPYSNETKVFKNSNGRYSSSVSVHTALTQSLNMPALRVIEKVGPENAVQFAQSVFGFKSKLFPALPLVLGASAVTPLEMAQGYSVFMLNGDRFTPFGITRIVGPDGTVLKQYQSNIKQRVLSADTASLMDDLLRGVVTGGTATRARSIANARGKTGTTSENKDAWFIGYTDRFLGVGWIANEQRTHGRWVYEPMARRVFGGTHTIQMWTGLLESAQRMVGEKPVARQNRDEEVRIPSPNREPAVSDGTEDRPTTDGAVVAPDTQPDVQPKTGGDIPDDLEPVPPKTKPPVRKAPPSDPPPREAEQPELVKVWICADTGLLATPYCPERVHVSYSRGHEPKRRCRVHGPEGG